MSAPKPFIENLNGVRAIAALTVVVSHSANHGLLPQILGAGAGRLGVMLFFTLSGFLMAYLYIDNRLSRKTVSQYANARFGRVYPLYAAVILASALFFAMDSNFPYHMNLDNTLSHILLFGDENIFWTISPEFQFYILFAGFWYLFQNLPSAHRLAIFFGICATLYAILYFADFPGGRIAITRYLHFFMLGQCAGITALMLKRRGLDTLPMWGAATALFMACYFVSFPGLLKELFGLTFPAYKSLILNGLMALIVVSAAMATDKVTRAVLGNKVMCWLGEISFGIYLLHIPLIYLLTEVIPPPLPGWVTFGLLIGLLLGISQLAHITIEKPARTVIRRLNAPLWSYLIRRKTQSAS